MGGGALVSAYPKACAGLLDESWSSPGGHGPGRDGAVFRSSYVFLFKRLLANARSFRSHCLPCFVLAVFMSTQTRDTMTLAVPTLAEGRGRG